MGAERRQKRNRKGASMKALPKRKGNLALLGSHDCSWKPQ